jgi:hypothetical protein
MLIRRRIDRAVCARDSSATVHRRPTLFAFLVSRADAGHHPVSSMLPLQSGSLRQRIFNRADVERIAERSAAQ